MPTIEAFADALGDVRRSVGANPDALERLLAIGRAAIAADCAASAIGPLEAARECCPDNLALLRVLAQAYRAEQRLVAAEAIYRVAIELAPDDAGARVGLAQTRFELGLPAAACFQAAELLAPGHRELVRNRAASMAAEGDLAGATALLERTLATAPDWLDGHRALAVLRWTAGDREGHAASYAAACAREPKNAGLWLAWFRLIAQTRDWPGALSILDAAERVCGVTSATTVGRLFVAVESADTPRAESLLAATANLTGDVVNLCRIRQHLRCGRPQLAADVAGRQVGGRSTALYWPYLSLAWRLQRDALSEWLDRPGELIQMHDVELSGTELSELADTLRSLHSGRAPYLEQSVRGGSQTDRSVLLRHEPIFGLVRARLLEAIRGYVARLPAASIGHPLLGTPRGVLRVEGSWSVRLEAQGYNVPHTHPMGWLSTAFYVALPSSSQMGPAPAGHIAFGAPPPELGLSLAAYRHIRPKVGAMAIFPSTMWHATEPFADGERLVLAFDVRTPTR